MNIEIERKFLVKNDDFKKESVQKTRLIQGYLSSVPKRTVRIRIKGNTGFLTIKGLGDKSGLSRYEWEREIPYSDAKQLLKICEKGEIDKYRYIVKFGNHAFEVDEYLGDNSGLVIAEIELSHEDEMFAKPDWLGREVTGIKKYYNSMLLKKPSQVFLAGERKSFTHQPKPTAN